MIQQFLSWARVPKMFSHRSIAACVRTLIAALFHDGGELEASRVAITSGVGSSVWHMLPVQLLETEDWTYP